MSKLEIGKGAIVALDAESLAGIGGWYAVDKT
jgi:hypothetical protein